MVEIKMLPMDSRGRVASFHTFNEDRMVIHLHEMTWLNPEA